MDSFTYMSQKMSHALLPKSGKDFDLFRPNVIVAALMLSLMVSPVGHAETIVYESGPLRSNPLMAGKALFPDAASGNSVTNIGKVDGSMFGGMSTDKTVENNTVYAKAGVSQYVMGGISGDTDARNNQVFIDGALMSARFTARTRKATGVLSAIRCRSRMVWMSGFRFWAVSVRAGIPGTIG